MKHFRLACVLVCVFNIVFWYIIKQTMQISFDFSWKIMCVYVINCYAYPWVLSNMHTTRHIWFLDFIIRLENIIKENNKTIISSLIVILQYATFASTKLKQYVTWNHDKLFPLTIIQYCFHNFSKVVTVWEQNLFYSSKQAITLQKNNNRLDLSYG